MDNKKNIYQKILAVQSEIGTLTKGKDNPFFKSKYFDVNDVIENLQPLLTKYKLCVIQPLNTAPDGRANITTIVSDVEGEEELIFTTPLPEVAKAQDMGSAITYLRRYTLQSFFLLQAEDDDGNKASGKTEKKKGMEGKEIAALNKTMEKETVKKHFDVRDVVEAPELL